MIADGFDLKHWESKFFDRQIFSYSGSLHEFEETNSPRNSLISLKIKADDYERIDLATKNGFRLVEGEVVYEKCLSEHSSSTESLEYDNFIAGRSSIDELNEIVTGLYVTSRFREPWFTSEEKDNFYRCWLENAVLSKFDDCCLVVRSGGMISGFVTLRISDQIATIGLIGVASPYQGLGIGKKLLSLAMRYSKAKFALSIKVSTQLSNLAASNLYSSTGFSAVDRSYWFYKQV